MPCRDWVADEEDRQVAREEHEILETGMCAVLTVLENSNQFEDMMATIDWDEAGISRWKLEKWWEDHKKKDAKRRAEAEKAARASELRKKALSKLSYEEKKALGL